MGLFLVKEIKSKAGELHFRRWRLLSTSKRSIFIHKIYMSDDEPHPHTHPWDFTSLILSGGYVEYSFENGDLTKPQQRICTTGDIIRHKAEDAHRIQIIRPTTTLVFTGEYRRPDWGFQTDKGFVHHEEYFRQKDIARRNRLEAFADNVKNAIIDNFNRKEERQYFIGPSESFDEIRNDDTPEVK